MSDFDKEAEREKLREQFAEDDRGRESTQRMSELLLQGATMTNKHCDVHGDPIFRYDGEEFCPTCRSEGQRTQESGENAAPEQRGDATPDRSPAAEASSPDAADAADTDGQRHDLSPAAEQSVADLSPDDIAGSEWSPESDPVPSPDATRQADAAPTPRSTDSHADLADARASLARTVTRFADEAEAAEDLSRAREYLAAVEDAADALAAVRDAER